MRDIRALACTSRLGLFAMQKLESGQWLRRSTLALFGALFASTLGVMADDTVPAETPAQRGLRRLRTEAYAPPDFTVGEFDRLWQVWPDELKKAAEAASPSERRRMTIARYGLVADPDRPEGPPLGVVDDGQGGWAMNCLACHQGKVAGRVIPGVGNSLFAFQTLTQDIGKLKVADGDKKAAGDSMGPFIPLGRSNGTTNAQVFSVVLTALRDKDLNLLAKPKIPKFQNHDLDAPPYWNVKLKHHLYIDGFVPKTHRVIMQFALTPTNTADSFKEREDAFRDILAWIESLEAPRYPWPINEELAAQGRTVFETTCADCHGTYGPEGRYPEKTVSLETIGTDSTRLVGMPVEHRQFYHDSWFGEYGKLEIVANPEGYVAPPLNGVWASAPYFHNGSVPTLWHVLHSAERPVVWLRSEDGYDRERAGLEVSTFDKLPAGVDRADEKRRYFDTRMAGKSAAGHLFPDELSEDDKQAVLEYLKTL